MFTTTEKLTLFRDIQRKAIGDNTVNVSKQTRKVLDFPSNRSIRYCCNLTVWEGYCRYLHSSRPKWGDANLCKICPIHDQLPAEAVFEFARILRQLRVFNIAFLFSLLFFVSMLPSGITKYTCTKNRPIFHSPVANRKPYCVSENYCVDDYLS